MKTQLGVSLPIDLRIGIILIMLTFFGCERENITNAWPPPGSSMYVWENRGERLTAIDYNALEVQTIVNIGVPDGVQLYGGAVCLSTDEKYLVFGGGLQPSDKHIIVSYDLERGRLHSIYETGLVQTGANRLGPALKADKPGLIYFYSHLTGLFAIDFLDRDIRIISDERAQGLSKEFYYTLDRNFVIINKSVFDNDSVYSQLEFYHPENNMGNSPFIFNKSNQDSLLVFDLAFSDENRRVYFSSVRSGFHNKFEPRSWGWYEWPSGRLFRSRLRFPYSPNPHKIAFSALRKELYLIGGENVLFIVDAEADSLKTTVTLPGKTTGGASPMVLDPLQERLFISSAGDALISVIDLESKRLTKELIVPRPYRMIIPKR